MVTKNMNDTALTISVTWHEIGKLLKENIVSITDETLNWAKELLMDNHIFVSDMILKDTTFARHCHRYLAIHPECGE